MNELNSYLYDISIDKINPEDNEAILEIGFGNGKFFDKIL
jgi:16S rRNA A1518/A1519 N6-dimethyltransferase RsmA/KsgA/DIM1 with predicted DNA glycosylase/AP lyase activity